jgi:hypothetical protein
LNARDSGHECRRNLTRDCLFRPIELKIQGQKSTTEKHFIRKDGNGSQWDTLRK